MPSSPESQPSSAEQGQEPRLRRILMVDDEPQVILGVRRVLIDLCEVVEAHSGREALDKLANEGPFSVVISDLRMPEMDGIELLERVRVVAPDSIRIMLSGTVDMASTVRAINDGGIQRLLIKPAEPGQLANTLASAFAEHDVRQQERAQAFEDPLLCIGTRRAFGLASARVLAHARRHQRSFAVVMVDVDYFKRYNDSYGHVAGDEVLRRIAQTLRQTKRTSDELFRYGGEELVLLLPDTNSTGTAIAIERFRSAIDELSIPHIGSELGNVTISIGAAVSGPAQEVDFKTVVDWADKALYAAKQQGRNHATVWRDLPYVKSAERRDSIIE